MKKTKRIITWILNRGTLISATGFIGATLIQIYARFLMDSAPAWTEEAARFFFVYAMSFAAGLAMISPMCTELKSSSSLKAKAATEILLRSM